jgi:hypothetical protein
LTEEDVCEMMQQQWKVLNTFMQQNAEWMEVNRQLRQESIRPSLSTMKENFMMTQPKQFLGEDQDLEIFVGALRSKFRTHRHLFPNSDSDKMQYCLDHLASWANNCNQSQQKMSMTNPVSRDQVERNHEDL